MSEISVIGCGLMGSALVRTLAKGGTPLTIWNRTRQKAEAVVQSGVTGVTVADSVGAALEASPWTIFNIANCADCLTLLENEQRRLRGKIIIELTTGTPHEARRLGAHITTAGGRYLDGAIIGYPNLVGTPQLQILCSGDPAAFATCRTMLERLGGVLFLGENPGAASAFDLSCIIPVVPLVVGLLQAVKICRNEGVPLDQYEAFIKKTIPLMVTDILDKARQEDFATNPDKIESSVSVMVVISRLIANYSRDADIDPEMFDALTRLFEAGVASGRGEHDWVCAADLHTGRRPVSSSGRSENTP